MTALPHVHLRQSSGPVYAGAGEATYCRDGHLLGHFNAEVMVGETAPEKLSPVEGMSIGAPECHICGAPVQIGGLYFFEAQP